MRHISVQSQLLMLMAIFSVVIGFGFRVYIAGTAALWRDEAASISTTQQPLVQILSGAADPGHPPGYYLFLALAQTVSDHLFFLRFLSIAAFGLNCWLLYQLAKRFVDRQFGFIVLCFYALSGYFVVFDWQVRMYTLTVSFILASQLLHLRAEKELSIRPLRLLVISLVDALGLYFSYSYVWYFVPKSIYYVWIHLSQIRQAGHILAFSGLSLGLFFALYPQFFSHFNQGIDGIMWIKPLLSPSFFVPFLFGVLERNWLTAVILMIGALVMIGVTIYQRNHHLLSLVFFSLFSLITTLIYSYVSQPLFHVRSMQIIGLTIVLLIAYMVYLMHKKSIVLCFLSLCAQLLVLVFASYQILYLPGNALISYLPWKHIISPEYQKYDEIVYTINYPPSNSRMIFGLEYSLSGKEVLGQVHMSHRIADNDEVDTANCQLLDSTSISVYGCTY